MRAAFSPLTMPDCDHQRLDAHDVHHPGEIVGEDMERHFGSDLRQTLHEEVRRPHPHLQRTKGMLGCLATLAHRVRVLIEALLHGLEQVLMLPSRDSSLLTCRAARLIAQLDMPSSNSGAASCPFSALV